MQWEFKASWGLIPNWKLYWADGNTNTVDERLKTLGFEGWELVNTMEFSIQDGAPEYHYFFKRLLD